ncbi:carbohydrate ABC transporter permease [Cohnella sp.]|uniref:carbohydrate ABC transporter permease n=1 Tax=Cohnella sp. TaxID=1883426 RepID=UPI0035665047
MTSDNKKMQWIAHAALTAFSIACAVPFLLLILSSVSSEQAILKHGYSFFPKEFSLSAYHYLWDNWRSLGRAYGITVLITIVGTTVSLAMTSMLAYPISRRDLPWRNFWAFFVFFTLLFNGGLVPAYLIYTKLFVIKNTIWALIVPGLLMNGFNVLLVRTFFITSVPPALIEAANIDGCGEVKAFYKIVLPLSLPIMATIGLLQSILYWNDWFNGMTYVTDSKLFSIQNILNRMITEIQFLSSDPNMSTSASETIAQLPSATVRMAIAVVGVLPILVAYPFFQKYFVKGITIGAVK